MDKEDVVHVRNVILLRHEKNKIMPFAVTWMDLEITISEDKYHTISKSFTTQIITML